MMKRKYLLLLTPLSLLILLLAKASPWMAEYIFARGLFRILAVPMGLLTGILPFSLAEILLYLLPLLVLLLLVRFCYLMVRKKERIAILKRWLLNAGVVGSILLFLFVALCGAMYYRNSIAEVCGLEVEKYSAQDLYEVCMYLVEQANETKAQVTQVDENQVVVVEDFRQLSADAAESFQILAKEYPVFRYSTGKVKPVLLSHYMSYTGIVGIYCPFTMEANVNTDTAGYNRPADATHELAHLHGFLPEDEANFISYLACTFSDKAYFQYSGYMMALIYTSNALYEEDVEKYMEVFAGLSDEVKADLIYENDYWDELESQDAYQTVEAASDKINDTYLKANGQESGVKSYGEMVDLLIAYYKISH
jgi:hypothetical protein